MTPELLVTLERIHDEIPKKPKQAIAELEALLTRHPDVPKLYNFLAAAHGVVGHRGKVRELAEEAYRRFPDYLFSKINYAQVQLDKGEFKAIPDVFEHKFDLKLLYPDRDVFHVSEFISFNAVLCVYYCYAGEKDLAKMLYDNLLEVAPESPMIAYARSFLKPSLRMRLKLWLAKKAGSVNDNIPPPPKSPYRFKA
ncbi:hypothetical protein Q9L42_005555 [Methylomarinum sp. Ch1-1]|uniref:Tetratricopeptide repeat protein n=1 Tax=Methylomarinum roseum TaxID=3067653 RepID=A0AAU7NX69_9GAMM|nr:hypothetical protein [Methylomarinum sp. Ch1-1]MDP4522331.1 hypothetical protein [Methylomarinum sp. Ch1-1]